MISSGVRESIRYLAQHSMVRPECHKWEEWSRVKNVGPSSVGRRHGDHGWRDRGGPDQVFGPGVSGRIQPVWQGSLCKGHRQVRKPPRLMASTPSMCLLWLLQDWEPSDAWSKLQFAREMDDANFAADAAGAELSGVALCLFFPLRVALCYI